MSEGAPLVVVGGGEHARVVIEAARSRPGAFLVLGFLDPAPCEETAQRCGVRRLGGDDQAPDLAADESVRFVLGVGGVGAVGARASVADRLDAARVRWAAVVHAHAWVSPSAVIGDGVVVMAGACVNAGARLGRHAVVNTGAVVEHDVDLGAFAQVAPAAAVGGGSRVGRGSYLGLGSRVRDHITIGEGVTVGMGAVVVRGIADGETVVGVPARARRGART